MNSNTVDYVPAYKNCFGFYTKIVGVSFNNRQNLIPMLQINQPLNLIHEKNNRFDKNAIAVYYNNFHIGYIAKNISINLVDYVDGNFKVCAFVVGLTGNIDNFLGVNIYVYYY